VLAFATVALVIGGQLTAASAVPVSQITICHRTNSYTNPYVVITIDRSGADGVAGNQGHQADHFLEHDDGGGMFDPAVDTSGGDWDDIIPPVDNDGNPMPHNGLHWNDTNSTGETGQDIWLNGCKPNIPKPDVKITKTANKGTVNAGDGFTYTLKVESVSNTDATNVVITDSIPASLTIGALPSGCTKAGQAVTCNVGNLAAGASKSYAIPVTTSNASCPSVDNTGKVTADNDSNAANNEDSASVNVTCQTPKPNIAIEKTASKGTVASGDGFDWNLKVTNTSNVNATSVVIKDTIAGSLTIGTLPNGCTKTGQDITCNVGNLAAGASKTYAIPVTTSAASCPSVDNTGTVTATDDTNAGDNTDSASVNVTCNTPDVTITKSASAATVNANGSVTFTLKAENLGNADATGVTATDTFAAGLAITSAPGCTIAGQKVTCDLGTIAGGASKSVDVTVTATAAACPSVKNTAEVTATNEPSGAGGNNLSNEVTLNVTCPNPDVAIRKSSSAPVAGVFSGDSFTYTITVENVSGGDVNDVIVHDSIPAGLDITDTDSSCTVSGQDVTCDLGTVAAGASETLTITVTATDAACPEVTNTATVEGSNDSNSGNNTSNPVTDIVNCQEPGVAIRITKTNDANGDGRYTDTEEARRSGLDVPFRLVITNTGEEAVTLTDLTDTFPGDTINLLNGQCSNLSTKTLAPGESVKCLFTVKNYSPNSDAGYKTNSAEVCAQLDGGSTTDCDSDTSKVRSAEVLGRTITPPPTQTPPSGTAFTGSEGTITFGLLAMALLLFGTGVMYAGYRKRQRFDG